jgi:hypothetical protein
MLAVFVAAAAVLVVRPVGKVKASTSCSKASLKGNYSLVMTGNYSDGYAWDFSMLADFDGDGHLTGSDLFGVYDGENYNDGPKSFTGGTYTINSNCTCTLDIPANPIFDGEPVTLHGVVMSPTGSEVVGTGYFNEAWAGTFDAKPVTE